MIAHREPPPIEVFRAAWKDATPEQRASIDRWFHPTRRRIDFNDLIVRTNPQLQKCMRAWEQASEDERDNICLLWQQLHGNCLHKTRDGSPFPRV
jgi:hypothetical protein